MGNPINGTNLADWLQDTNGTDDIKGFGGNDTVATLSGEIYIYLTQP